jgi:ATP/maltotriose-dependent transcriptional regulator MalT
MRREISAVRATRGTPRAWRLCLLASGLGKGGRPQEGLQVLEEGFASVAKTREQLSSPFAASVKGDLLLVQNPSNVAQAERYFHTAIEIARRQSARSADLRATTSLARLLNEQGNRDKARTMLADIYGWFTEASTLATEGRQGAT